MGSRPSQLFLSRYTRCPADISINRCHIKTYFKKRGSFNTDAWWGEDTDLWGDCFEIPLPSDGMGGIYILEPPTGHATEQNLLKRISSFAPQGRRWGVEECRPQCKKTFVSISLRDKLRQRDSIYA